MSSRVIQGLNEDGGRVEVCWKKAAEGSTDDGDL
jgi:hypothetical protein